MFASLTEDDKSRNCENMEEEKTIWIVLPEAETFKWTILVNLILIVSLIGKPLNQWEIVWFV